MVNDWGPGQHGGELVKEGLVGWGGGERLMVGDGIPVCGSQRQWQSAYGGGKSALVFRKHKDSIKRAIA